MNSIGELSNLNSPLSEKVVNFSGQVGVLRGMTPPLLTDATPASKMAVASEELTFQFSQVVEAKEKALAEKLSRSTKISNEDTNLRVEQIMAIMKLLEGKDGYVEFKNHARMFANQFLANPETALRELDLKNISPERKYTMIKIALESVKQMNTKRADFQDHLDRLNDVVTSMDSPFIKAKVLADAVSVNENEVAKFKDDFFGSVAMTPSVRSIFDMANEHAKSADRAATLVKMQKIWGNQINGEGLQLFGAVVIVHKVMQLIQTMLHDSKNFLNKIGFYDNENIDYIANHTRHCIEVAQSTMPSSLIDKLTESVRAMKRACPRCRAKQKSSGLVATAARCTCTDFKPYLLSVLHWHAVRWPYGLWINPDAKKAMLEQLVRKQGAPQGLAGKRLMR